MIPNPIPPGADENTFPQWMLIFIIVFYTLFVIACLLLIFNRPLLDKISGYFGGWF